MGCGAKVITMTTCRQQELVIIQLEMSKQRPRILVWSARRSWAGDRTENHPYRKSTISPLSGMELPRETV